MTDSQALEKECPECKGDGVAERIGGYERPCDACHGEGFVQRPQPSGDEVERVARALWLKDREHDLKEAALAWDDPASMEHSDYWLERMPRNYARHRGMARAALAAMDREPVAVGETGAHPSHTLRSSDASTFDFVCTKCGFTDAVPGGWGELAHPCAPKENNHVSD